MCFTNYKDAIPISENDRRWWVIFNDLSSLDEIEEKTGIPRKLYYKRLYSYLNLYSDEIHKWLLEYTITETFREMKRAPLTPYKESMLATFDGSVEGLEEVKELINKGGELYNEEVISSSDLFFDLLNKTGIKKNTNKRSEILGKLGYLKMPKPMTINGKTKQIWTKRTMTKDEARSYLVYGLEYLDDL